MIITIKLNSNCEVSLNIAASVTLTFMSLFLL